MHAVHRVSHVHMPGAFFRQGSALTFWAMCTPAYILTSLGNLPARLANQVFTVEPMLNLGKSRERLPEGWMLLV